MKPLFSANTKDRGENSFHFLCIDNYFFKKTVKLTLSESIFLKFLNIRNNKNISIYTERFRIFVSGITNWMEILLSLSVPFIIILILEVFQVCNEFISVPRLHPEKSS